MSGRVGDGKEFTRHFPLKEDAATARERDFFRPITGIRKVAVPVVLHPTLLIHGLRLPFGSATEEAAGTVAEVE